MVKTKSYDSLHWSKS